MVLVGVICDGSLTVVDTNNDGLINQEEIAAILQSLELTPDTDDLERMMQEADLNNDGVIDFNEFLRVVSKVKSSETN
jgi:Ca2+-binding EF-hand superfamily protein